MMGDRRRMMDEDELEFDDLMVQMGFMDDFLMEQEAEMRRQAMGMEYGRYDMDYMKRATPIKDMIAKYMKMLKKKKKTKMALLDMDDTMDGSDDMDLDTMMESEDMDDM